MPTFNNKYLSDKEYCFYFRKGGYCNPRNYTDAKTVFEQPINSKDKKQWSHPTIKPLNIIETLIKNSSLENETILDCFAGSFTTAVACENTNRKWICIEKEQQYFDIGIERLKKLKEST